MTDTTLTAVRALVAATLAGADTTTPSEEYAYAPPETRSRALVLEVAAVCRLANPDDPYLYTRRLARSSDFPPIAVAYLTAALDDTPVFWAAFDDLVDDEVVRIGRMLGDADYDDRLQTLDLAALDTLGAAELAASQSPHLAPIYRATRH